MPVWMLIAGALGAGPDAWTGRTPVGELRPGVTQTRLVHEELVIRVMDLDHVEVRATYQVHNPSETPEIIRFGVPVTSGGTGGADRTSEEAASVRVLAGGVFVPCLVGAGERFEVPVASAVQSNVVDRWCTSDLTIQPGSSELRMSYEGSLFWESSSSPAALVDGGADRRLMYALFPAAGWAKQADELAITVDLGPYAGRGVPVKPDKGVVEGRFISWTFPKPDYQRLRWLEVELIAGDRDRHARIAQHNATGPVWSRPSSIRTSAELTGRPAAAALDGDPSTAWCMPGDAGWAELLWAKRELPAGFGPSCTAALLVVPGDSAAAGGWSASGRATHAKLGVCGGPSSQVEFPVGASAEEAGRAVLVDPATRAAWITALSDGKKPACVRVEVTRSTGAPVCFAELAWQVDCL